MKEAFHMTKKRDSENIFSRVESITSGVLKRIWSTDKAHFTVKEKKLKVDGSSINLVDHHLFVLKFEYNFY